MIDDGEFAGVPIGGLGHGSIGRTYRGDAARWHLEVGQHRHEPVAAGRVLAVRRRPGRRRGRPSCRPSGPTEPAGVGLDAARRRRDVPRACFPRAWQAFEPDVLGVRVVGEQLSPVIARRPRAERPARSGSSSGGSRTQGPTR